MKPLDAMLLGLVQGITEFLPISSSGHLVLLEHVLGWRTSHVALGFNVLLHLSTLLVVLVYFYKDFLTFAQMPIRSASTAVVCGLAPVGVLVLGGWHAAFENLHQDLWAVATGYVVSAVFLFSVSGNVTGKASSFSYFDGVITGMAQLVALTPGVSRSGMTVCAGLRLGKTREAAVRFSFFIGAPVMAGAILLECGEIVEMLRDTGGGVVLLGMLTAACSGWVALKLLIRTVLSGNLHLFAWYCVIMAMLSAWLA